MKMYPGAASELRWTTRRRGARGCDETARVTLLPAACATRSCEAPADRTNADQSAATRTRANTPVGLRAPALVVIALLMLPPFGSEASSPLGPDPQHSTTVVADPHRPESDPKSNRQPADSQPGGDTARSEVDPGDPRGIAGGGP